MLQVSAQFQVFASLHNKGGGSYELCFMPELGQTDLRVLKEAGYAVVVQRLLDGGQPDPAGLGPSSAEHDKVGIEQVDKNGKASAYLIPGRGEKVYREFVTFGRGSSDDVE